MERKIVLMMLVFLLMSILLANETYGIDAIPPTIDILSPETIIYFFPHCTPIPPITLTFVVSEPTSWIGYSRDGQENVTITGNTTLADLSYGEHTVIVYANDTVGNMGSSEAVKFTLTIEGDVNGDGCVDIVDIVIIALRFGELFPECPIGYYCIDLNHDGIVDIVDIVMVAIHFGACISDC